MNRAKKGNSKKKRLKKNTAQYMLYMVFNNFIAAKIYIKHRICNRKGYRIHDFLTFEVKVVSRFLFNRTFAVWANGGLIHGTNTGHP